MVDNIVRICDYLSMKPIKSFYINGITLEILTINKAYYVRKRVGTKTLVMRQFNDLELATMFFCFIK